MSLVKALGNLESSGGGAAELAVRVLLQLAKIVELRGRRLAGLRVYRLDHCLAIRRDGLLDRLSFLLRLEVEFTVLVECSDAKSKKLSMNLVVEALHEAFNLR